MQSAGVEGEQVLLLMEDHHLVTSAFLEIINCLLMAGEVRCYSNSYKLLLDVIKESKIFF